MSLLLASRTTLDPGEVAAWNVFDSATTQTVGTNSRDKRRIIRWDASGLYVSPQKCYLLHGFNLDVGAPGRLLDLHTSPADAPWGWTPPCSGSVAPYALDYKNTSAGLELVIEPEDAGCSGGSGTFHYQVLTQAETEAARGTWVWLWHEIVWGRSGLTYDGSVRIWKAGENAPRVSIANVNTHWTEQHFVSMWEGAYLSGGAPSLTRIDSVACRVGRTPKECYQDIPTLFVREGAGSPAGSSAAIADVQGGTVAIPLELQWAGGGAGSVELSTTTEGETITHARNLCRAGSRLYATYNDGTNLVYQYSDDGGDTWSAKTTIVAGAIFRSSAFYDAVNGRLNFVYAGGNSASQKLALRAIAANVTSGAPGALSAETVIDAGGANLGVLRPYALHSATGANPRYWIIACKFTAAGNAQTRAWLCAAGAAADTAGNWSTTNFTNLGANGGTGNTQYMGIGAWWQVAGAEKVTFVFGDGELTTPGTVTYEAVTFDPTVATPTPGTVTSIASSAGTSFDWFAFGAPIALAAKADYLVFGRLDKVDDKWDFFKTVAGTAWSTPAGWADLTMGRAQLGSSGADLYLLHSDSYGAILTTAQPLKFRKVTTSTDTIAAAQTFSDQNGNGVAVPLDTGTSLLYGLWRASTASPYSVRADAVDIAASQPPPPPPPPAAGQSRGCRRRRGLGRSRLSGLLWRGGAGS